MSSESAFDASEIVDEIQRRFVTPTSATVEVCGRLFQAGDDELPLQAQWKGVDWFELDTGLELGALPECEKLAAVPLRALGSPEQYVSDLLPLFRRYLSAAGVAIRLPSPVELREQVAASSFFELAKSAQNEIAFGGIEVSLVVRLMRLRFESRTDSLSLLRLFGSQVCGDIYRAVKPRRGSNFREFF